MSGEANPDHAGRGGREPPQLPSPPPKSVPVPPLPALAHVAPPRPLIPPPVYASPAEVRFAQGEPERWYLPGWGETIRLLGWRVLLFVPAIGLVLLILTIPLHPLGALNLLLPWWKVWVFVAVVPMLIAVERVKNAIRSRTDPFCIHCGYGLTGLPPEHTCPECGAAYTPALIEEYKRDPHWFIQRYRANRKIPQPDAPFAAGSGVTPPSGDGT